MNEEELAAVMGSRTDRDEVMELEETIKEENCDTKEKISGQQSVQSISPDIAVQERTGERLDCAKAGDSDTGVVEAESAGREEPAAEFLDLPPEKQGMRLCVVKRHSVELPETAQDIKGPFALLNTVLPVREEPYTANDYGNARRFLDRYSALVRYCPEEKRWYLFQGVKWASVPVEEIQKRVRDVLFLSHEEEQAKLEAEHRHREAVKSEEARLSCGKMSNIKSCMEAAALDCFIHPQDFDADIYRFHTANGSIHLKTLEETWFHKTGDFHTRTASASLREGAQDAQDECPMWVRFVKQCCMGDMELYKYLQAAAGYSVLTGDIREQKVFCLLGEGRNGKSLFINVLAYIAGDYACKLESSVLCTDRFGKKSDETEKELYRIRGSRFVYSNEFSKSSILNESFIKTITDGGLITCRPMYKESIEYMPTDTLWFSTNHMPALQAMDEGIRRRIAVIPFRRHLKEDEIDRNLEAKLLSEADGILAWLIQGYLRYCNDGLNPPRAVIDATRSYFEEQDPVCRFVDEYYIQSRVGKSYARDIYQAYKHWCAENGEEEKSQRFLGQELRRIGIAREKDRDGVYYLLERK